MSNRVALGQATQQPLKGAPIPDKLFPGDEVTFTAGRELYAPVKYNNFEVGPVTVKTCVGPGETAAEAYARAAVAAKTMFEAEFHLKRIEYFQRLGQIEIPK